MVQDDLRGGVCEPDAFDPALRDVQDVFSTKGHQGSVYEVFRRHVGEE